MNRQVAIGSLPGQLRSSAPIFPSHAGYLRTDPARTRILWKRRLHALGSGLKIGIAWSGGAPYDTTREPLDASRRLAARIRAGKPHFVSLQHGTVSESWRAFHREHHIRFMTGRMLSRTTMKRPRW